MVRVFSRLLVFTLLLVTLAIGAAAWWLSSPIRLNLPAGSQVLDLEIEPGTPAAQVAEAVVASGADVNLLLLQVSQRYDGACETQHDQNAAPRSRQAN